MAVVAVVSGTADPDRVVLEATRLADERDTTVYVLYVLGLGWITSLQLAIGEAFGLPTDVDAIREAAERNADRIAAPVIDDYEAVGRVGRPVDEIVSYSRAVDADCVVIDDSVNWGSGVWRWVRDPLTALRDEGVIVVPVS